MKTLLINAHPYFNNDATYTAKLKNLFLEKFNTAFPEGEIEELNLYDIALPRLESDQLLHVWSKLVQEKNYQLKKAKSLRCLHFY